MMKAMDFHGIVMRFFMGWEWNVGGIVMRCAIGNAPGMSNFFGCCLLLLDMSKILVSCQFFVVIGCDWDDFWHSVYHIKQSTPTTHPWSETTNEERLTARRDENQHDEKHAFAQAAFTCLWTLLTLERRLISERGLRCPARESVLASRNSWYGKINPLQLSMFPLLRPKNKNTKLVGRAKWLVQWSK